MSIEAAFALPHPPLAVHDVGKGEEEKIQKTLDSFARAGKEIGAIAPETIIFVTPHNVSYADYFHISPGTAAVGNFGKFNARQAMVSKMYDLQAAKAISEEAGKAGIPAGGQGERNSDLDHGTMVPMWFIDKEYKDYKCVRISQSGLTSADHYKFGQCIARAMDRLGRKAVLIASGDLSHKLLDSGPYGFSEAGPVYDKHIVGIFDSANFLELFGIDESRLEAAGECGFRSYVIMAGLFDKKKVKSEVFSYEGPFGVGYAIASFYPQEEDESRGFLSKAEESALEQAKAMMDKEDAYQSLARRSLEHFARLGKPLRLSEEDKLALPKEMENKAGAFVSLHKEGRLRGCVGTIGPTTASLALEITQNAVSAGFHDNRFPRVKPEELPFLDYKVDVLAPAEPIPDESLLDPKRYGVIVTSGGRRGLLLPDLEGIDTIEKQVSIARKKAGIGEGEKISLERFEVIRHG
ncbi:MAG: AmmeMemoRadiSam system protein A [Clostridiales bacterium]|nr:AmmeMemoRadiSam system protein A [Clostridiales bacterium]